MKRLLLLLAAILAFACEEKPVEPVTNYDLCVYGGTASGVVAAYSAAQLGMKVALVSPDQRLGGLTTGGLGFTDIGNKVVATGVAKQFYRTLGKHYGRLESWIFEPSVAERVINDLASHENITIYKGYFVDVVTKGEKRITQARFECGEEFLNVAADYYIDATYEGDLMARSEVSYIVGREDNKVYNEEWNGEYFHPKNHQFPDGVDPYVEKGSPLSGLLPHIQRTSSKGTGRGDDLVQAYNYRICLTDDPENMVPITRPDNYDPDQYELLLRLIEAQPDKRKLNDYFIWSHMPNRKTDINNRGGFSTDCIGMNWDYPEASYQKRRKIVKKHEEYTKGLLYFIGHDERVPLEMREEMLRWGYPKDEYVEFGHWTPQLYIREARRMIGEYVTTQHNCDHTVTAEDGIAMAAYGMDSHNCKRVVVEKSGVKMVKNEGNVEVKVRKGPYPISYRSLIPKRDECENLLVPVCLSASHIAYGSIRMEPVFMELGQVCAIAAKLADGKAVQDVDHKEINAIMKRDPYLNGATPDIIIDDDSEGVVASDGWVKAQGSRGYGKTFYELQGGERGGRVVYKLPNNLNGEWEIFSYQRAKGDINPVTTIVVELGMRYDRLRFDLSKMERRGQVSGDWFPLGCYSFGNGIGGTVTIIAPPDDRPSYADAILLVKR